MAQQAQQVYLSDLPPATLLFNTDIFVINQVGGDGYTKKINYSTVYKSISSIILPDLYNIKLDKAGGTMTGNLFLNEDPTSPLQASTKRYVDDVATYTLSVVKLNYLTLSGGTMTGFLTLTGNPTLPLDAATKQYVDAQVASVTCCAASPSYSVQIGTVINYAGRTAPTGYLVCSGGTIPNGSGVVQGIAADFSALYTILGTNYGDVPGTLPDLRASFVRGWTYAGDGPPAVNNTNFPIDAGRTFGSTQTDQVGQHGLPIRCVGRVSDGDSNYQAYVHTSKSALLPGIITYPNKLPSDPTQSDSWIGTQNIYPGGNTWVRFDAVNTQLSAQETRPRNVAMLPCIKY